MRCVTPPGPVNGCEDSAHAAANPPGAGTADRLGDLTASERAVVDLVARGATNREVAAQLFLSPHTVSTHLRHAFTKTGVRSRVELSRLTTLGEPDPTV